MDKHKFNSKQKDVALCSFGQNSCTLSTWIEFMNSVHVDINYRMIHVGNSTYLEKETSKRITPSAFSRFYV